VNESRRENARGRERCHVTIPWRESPAHRLHCRRSRKNRPRRNDSSRRKQ